jgi:hypothetical protein
MIAETWGGFFTLACIAAAFFAAGWLWRDESADREQQRRTARRTAHRINIKQKEGN